MPAPKGSSELRTESVYRLIEMRPGQTIESLSRLVLKGRTEIQPRVARLRKGGRVFEVIVGGKHGYLYADNSFDELETPVLARTAHAYLSNAVYQPLVWALFREAVAKPDPAEASTQSLATATKHSYHNASGKLETMAQHEVVIEARPQRWLLAPMSVATVCWDLSNLTALASQTEEPISFTQDDAEEMISTLAPFRRGPRPDPVGAAEVLTQFVHKLGAIAAIQLESISDEMGALRGWKERAQAIHDSQLRPLKEPRNE